MARSGQPSPEAAGRHPGRPFRPADPDVWRPAVPIIPDRTAGLFQLAPLSSERAGYFSLAWLLDILRTVLRLRRGDAMAIAPEKSMNELGAEFYTLMGNAISNWARVEAYLFKICRAALGATSQRTAIVYGRTPTIESRRLLVDDLLATRFPVRRQNGGSEHPDSREWKSISMSMQGLLPVRNQIAHRPMEPHLDWTESADGGVGKADLWFEITTSEHERERYGGPKGSLNVADLQKHILEVWSLKERLADFYMNKLPTHARLHP